MWIAIIVWLAAAAAPEGSPTWQRSYEQGVAAVERGDGAAAIPLLEAAIAERPEEALLVRTHGVHLVDYLPHLYLAWAHWLAGDPASARRSLAESDRQGMARKSEPGRELAGALRTLLREPAPVPTPSPFPSGSDTPRYRLFPPQPPSLSEVEYRRIEAEVKTACGIDPASPLTIAPWYFHYELALALDRRGDPQRALEALLVSTQRRPASQRRARLYGMRFSDYVPYFWIAREHARLGNWECVLDALRVSEEAGEVGEHDPEFAEFRALVEEAVRRRPQ
ncbi:MAG TPA: hypothetical protein P5234_01515 [Thermoanaerobaculaceae bacterium]|nr:hypothetical protein [Thermoanaerobaculaceae bacterium]HRS14904.1 hypothetical protein [Thermoanaerobaculaceae bacterium]